MFGNDDMYDIPLEVEAVELKVQLERMKSMFGLTARLKGEYEINRNKMICVCSSHLNSCHVIVQFRW